MVKTESNNPHTQARGHFFHRDAMGKPLATVVIIDCQRFWTFFSIPHAHVQVTSTHTSLSPEISVLHTCKLFLYAGGRVGTKCPLSPRSVHEPELP